MNADRFEQLAVAIERDRRRDYRISIGVMLAVFAGFLWLTYAVPGYATQYQRDIAESFAAGQPDAGMLLSAMRMTALWTVLQFGAGLMLFLLPFVFDRYRWRYDKALIELLRAQGNLQAKTP